MSNNICWKLNLRWISVMVGKIVILQWISVRVGKQLFCSARWTKKTSYKCIFGKNTFFIIEKKKNLALFSKPKHFAKMLTNLHLLLSSAPNDCKSLTTDFNPSMTAKSRAANPSSFILQTHWHKSNKLINKKLF